MLQDEPMRVAYVVKRYPRYSETFIVNEILAHEQAGLDIEIFSLRPPNDTHFQNTLAAVQAPVHYLPASGVKLAEFWKVLCNCGQALPGYWSHLENASNQEAINIYQAALLAQEIKRRGITHLHAHFGTVSTTVARLASLFSGRPYTFTAHAKDIYHESVVSEDLNQKISDASAVVTVSAFNVEYLQDRYPAALDKVIQINNGLSLKRFPYKQSQECARKIVTVGRLVEKKGFADLIDACSILKHRQIEFDCQIIGTGPLQEQLKNQIEHLGLTDWVSLQGPKPQREIVSLIQQAAVFAAPCVVGADGNRDGLPTVLLEAMALGTCCVATDVTGIPEIVEHKQTGMLIGQHDPLALAESIEWLLDNPAERLRLARAGRVRVEQNYDIHTNTQSLRDLFANANECSPNWVCNSKVLV